MKKNEIMKIETTSGMVELTTDIVRSQIAKGNTEITDAEILNFMLLCKYRKLNPFLGEAHLIKYGDTIQQVTGIDVFTDRLNNHPDCNGFEVGVIVLDKQKNIIKREGTFYLDNEELVGAYSIIHRKNWSNPIKWTIRISDYLKTFYNKKTNKIEPMGLWKTMPGVMLTKCCLVSTIRKAFSKEFSGMYAAEEFGIDENKMKDMGMIEIIPSHSNMNNIETITEDQIEELKKSAISKDEVIAKSYKADELIKYVVGKLKKAEIIKEESIKLISKKDFEHVKNFILDLVKKKEELWKKRNGIKEPVKKEEKEADFKSFDELDDLPLPDDTQFAKPANTTKEEKPSEK